MKKAMKNEKDTARFDVYTAVLSDIRVLRCVAGKVMPYASEEHKAVLYGVKWTMKMNLLQSFEISETKHTGAYIELHAWSLGSS
jgi:hypothetical protein